MNKNDKALQGTHPLVCLCGNISITKFQFRRNTFLLFQNCILLYSREMWTRMNPSDLMWAHACTYEPMCGHWSPYVPLWFHVGPCKSMKANVSLSAHSEPMSTLNIQLSAPTKHIFIFKITY